jgi:ribonuclease P protein component
MERLKQRADFLAAATGIKVPAAAFVLQMRKRADDGPVRFGFTVSKKVGNAVQRNRVRRRLKEIVRLQAKEPAQALTCIAGHDYVLVGRQAALKLPFDRITKDFAGALRRAHGTGR